VGYITPGSVCPPPPPSPPPPSGPPPPPPPSPSSLLLDILAASTTAGQSREASPSRCWPWSPPASAATTLRRCWRPPPASKDGARSALSSSGRPALRSALLSNSPYNCYASLIATGRGGSVAEGRTARRPPLSVFELGVQISLLCTPPPPLPPSPPETLSPSSGSRYSPYCGELVATMKFPSPRGRGQGLKWGGRAQARSSACPSSWRWRPAAGRGRSTDLTDHRASSRSVV
jgi:hypothetical protein